MGTEDRRYMGTEILATCQKTRKQPENARCWRDL
jgi:hypothetical protein